MIIILTNALRSGDLPEGGPVIVPNALISATRSRSREVNQGNPNASTVSLCNANFRRVRLGEATYMGRSCRGTP